MKTDLVHIFEVGPRDGLQNESQILSTSDKLWFIQGLAQAGLKDLEVGSFVRPDRVPQMKDTDIVCSLIAKGKLKLGGAKTWTLVPNIRGLERAIEAGVSRIALFTAATNAFAQANMGMSIKQSLDEFKNVIQLARKKLGLSLKIRGYISTAFGCPFEGKVRPSQALRVLEKLAELGVDQISIGDTIGVATPRDVQRLIQPALQILKVPATAVHFHDTRGTALANVLKSLELGVRTVDSSAGGLGGCPFAPGAGGNLATEDLVYMLDGMRVRSGVDLEVLYKLSLELGRKMKKPVASKYVQAASAKLNRGTAPRCVG